MAKFKEGDYVKMKGSCSGCKTGEVYKLCYGDKDGRGNPERLFARPLDTLDNGCTCDWLWEKVEPIEETVVEKKSNRFKVGDKVKYLGSSIGVIGCVHDGIVYMSSCIDGNHVYKMGDGGCCKEHGTFMGYGIFDNMELIESKPNFKKGDRVITCDSIIGYYINEGLMEREDGDGWEKDGYYIPKDYIPVSSNTYWCVNMFTLKHCPKEDILGSCLGVDNGTVYATYDNLIKGTYSNTLNSTGQLTRENIDRAIEALKVNSKNTMSNITKFVKESLLSGEEKLLRKHGFKTECGDYTSEGQSFAIALICKEKEAQMIEVAKGLEEATKNK